jgi:hypothetical protein
VLDSHIASHVLAESKALLPLLSVIFPKLGTGPALHRAIGSLKEQTYTVWEAVLVLTPETESAARQAALESARADSRIRCMEACGADGPADIFGRALEQSKGRIFCATDTSCPFKSQQFEDYLKAFSGLPAGFTLVCEPLCGDDELAAAVCRVRNPVVRVNALGLMKP